MKCPRCGASNTEGAAWCAQCFTPLGSSGTQHSAQGSTLREPGLAYDVSAKQGMFDADGKMIGAPGGVPTKSKSPARVVLLVGAIVFALAVAALGYYFIFAS